MSMIKSLHYIVAVLLLSVFLCPGCAVHSTFQGLHARVIYSPELGNNADELWPDAELKDLFSYYWALRFEGPCRKLFLLEADYVREMINEKRYNNFVKRAFTRELVDIVVVRIEQKHQFLYHIYCILHLKDEREAIQKVSIRDRWVKVENRWCHALRDPFMFPSLGL